MKPVFSPGKLRALALALAFGLAAAFTSMAFAGDGNRDRDDRDQGKVVGAYFEEWSIYYANTRLGLFQKNHAASQLTHLLYAFGGVTSAGCAIADPYADFQFVTAAADAVNGQDDVIAPGLGRGNFNQLLELKALHPKLKVLISIGGAGVDPSTWSGLTSTDASRKAFVAGCIDLFINGNNLGQDFGGNEVSMPGVFDGFDVDWEFPGPADKHSFTLLLQEFRHQLDVLGKANHKQYALTFFAPAGADNYSNIELAAAAKESDFLNLQGYDLHGIWESATNHQSALFEAKADPFFGQGLSVEPIVAAYLKAGVPGNKIVLGIPLYGRGWGGVANLDHGLYQSSSGAPAVPTADGTGTCSDLSGNTAGCDPLLTPSLVTYRTETNLLANGYRRFFDSKRIAAWLYNPTSQTFFTFDDPFVVQLKTEYVNRRVRGGLGGAYVWALKDDDLNSTVVKTMAEGLRHH
jgi:chitinase